jgi:hypothetical protein
MSKAISLKVDDDIFREAEEIVHKKNIPRNAYINEAILFYNKINKRKLLKKKLHNESFLVRKNSLDILKEFEKLEDHIPE